jgi:hypothetical protein
MNENTRNQVADSLDRLAEQSEWNPEIWQQCYDLVRANRENDLLNFAQDDIIHYSGEFHSHNILGFRVKPDRDQLTQYQQEFRDIATALRLRLSLEEARQKFEL